MKGCCSTMEGCCSTMEGCCSTVEGYCGIRALWLFKLCCIVSAVSIKDILYGCYVGYQFEPMMRFPYLVSPSFSLFLSLLPSLLSLPPPSPSPPLSPLLASIGPKLHSLMLKVSHAHCIVSIEVLYVQCVRDDVLRLNHLCGLNA